MVQMCQDFFRPGLEFQVLFECCEYYDTREEVTQLDIFTLLSPVKSILQTLNIVAFKYSYFLNTFVHMCSNNPGPNSKMQYFLEKNLCSSYHVVVLWIIGYKRDSKNCRSSRAANTGNSHMGKTVTEKPQSY